jgi:putative peptidoglycan lipid II flippase
MASATSYALRLVWALCIPATVGLWMLAGPIVTVLFERGEFTRADSIATAATLRAYAAGLMGVASVRVLASVYYALELPRVPVITALLTMLVNVVCAVVLMGPVQAADGAAAGVFASLINRATLADLDQVGLALAASVAISLNAVVLLLAATRALRGLEMPALWGSFARHGAAAAAMAALLSVWSAYAESVSGVVELAGGLALGGTVYLAAAFLLGSEELKDLLAPLAQLTRPRSRGEHSSYD